MNESTRSNSKKHSKRQLRSNPFIALLLSPTIWPVDFYRWSVAWVSTRRWWSILFTAPMIALLAATSAAIFLGGFAGPPKLMEKYFALAETADASGDKTSFDFYCRKLQRTSFPQNSQFKVGLFFDSHHQPRMALERMNDLAPDTSEGYARAHLWLVQDNRKNLVLITPENIAVRRHHAEIAYRHFKSEPDVSLDVCLELAEIWQRLGNPSDALKYLEIVAKQRPQYLLDVGQLNYRLGNLEPANLYRDRAEAYFRTQLQMDPTSFQTRVGLTKSLLMAKKYPDAIEIAKHGYNTTHDAKNRDLLMNCYTDYYDSLPVETKASPEGAELLRQNLKLFPDHVATLERIAFLVGQTANLDPQLKEFLDQAVASGNTPASLHQVLAAGYLKRQQYDIAKEHLEYAFGKNPRNIEILNNLAWCYAVSATPDLERAQALINQAVKLASADASLKPEARYEVRETRGLIALKFHRYQDAITDLEPLLSVFPNRMYLKQFLAEAYENIGDPEMADRLRKQADALDQKKTK